LSFREVLFAAEAETAGLEIIPIILFDPAASANAYHRHPDLKLVIKVLVFPCLPFLSLDP
jgi:hypothetical protein